MSNLQALFWSFHTLVLFAGGFGFELHSHSNLAWFSINTICCDVLLLRVQWFSMQVVINKCFLLNPVKNMVQAFGKTLFQKLFFHTFMRCVWKVTGLCTLHEKLLSQKKKHCFLWCHNALWFRKPNFSILWQLHSFLQVFLSKHFLCDRFVKIW